MQDRNPASYVELLGVKKVRVKIMITNQCRSKKELGRAVQSESEKEQVKA